MSTDPFLSQASNAIKAGDKDTARQLIGQALRINAQDADAWYMAAYVTDDHAKRVEALQRALKIDPLHERAQKALVGLQPVELDDPLAAFLSSPTTGNHAATYGVTPSGQPIINLTVHQANTNQAVAMGRMVELEPELNKTAFWIGILAATFFCIFGVSHLLNGKIGGAFGTFLLGTIAWPLLAIAMTAATGGVCLVAVLPLHIYLAYTYSKRGALMRPQVVRVAL